MTGLYVHIPFCVKKCAYCDFLSFTDGGRDEYVRALITEIGLLPSCRLDSVYIGGGTPTSLAPRQLLSIADAICSRFSLSADCEFTVEANPGTVGSAMAGALAGCCNRVSLGVQSLDDCVLGAIGRIHTAGDAFDSLRRLQRAKIKRVSCDLMSGLPSQTVKSHVHDMKVLADFVEHISVYTLILEEGTPLCRSVRYGSIALPDEDDADAMYFEAARVLPPLGLERYEVSNYARPGCESRHNVNYWEYGEYLAAGLGATSQQRPGPLAAVRRTTTSDMGRYIEALSKGAPPPSNVERIEGDEALFEHYMLGLRQTRGARRVRGAFDGYIEKGIAEGVFTSSNGRVALNHGWFDRANTVLEDMLGIAGL